MNKMKSSYKNLHWKRSKPLVKKSTYYIVRGGSPTCCVPTNVSRHERDNRAPLSAHQTDTVAIPKETNLMISRPSPQTASPFIAERRLFQNLVPKEKYDKNDVILEVTSGRTTGGDICQQFTREIFDMYQNYSGYKHWKFELLNYTPADYGGLHHAAARISGDNVYKHLKYEGGIHRVQRIPEVGLSSRMQRIHTGTMSVIVLPQPDEVDVKVDPKDLRIDTFRAKGAGGQHVNTTDSAVRLVHVPTGLVVECQQERSQIKNKEIALRVLRARLYQQIIEKDKCQQQSARKLQVGTRAQSERIRTYNFTQDRVTDHRIAYEVRDIKKFLCGEKCLDQLIQRLLQSADEEAIIEFLDENFKSTKC
ncbi:peptide chain release factor 1, mitochondrial isoform 3-T8 [Molossus nigricans]